MASDKGNISDCRCNQNTSCWSAVNAVDLKLTNDDIDYLEEPYVAHDLVGVMADNKATANDNNKVGLNMQKFNICLARKKISSIKK